jgi:hypothetical protein
MRLWEATKVVESHQWFLEPVSARLLGSQESVRLFFATDVPMIAFTRLVVKAQNALAIHYVRQPILERVA